jgi:hypothetical protein
MQQNSINPDLLAEVERLREEVKRLKKNFWSGWLGIQRERNYNNVLFKFIARCWFTEQIACSVTLWGDFVMWCFGMVECRLLHTLEVFQDRQGTWLYLGFGGQCTIFRNRISLHVGSALWQCDGWDPSSLD